MRLLVATGNLGKLRELRELLADMPALTLLSLADVPPVPEVVEDSATFEENAIKKAVHTARATGLMTLADDSGLEVDALGGEPGVHSARYAGEHGDDRANNDKLLAALADVDDARRTARFRAVLALARPVEGGELDVATVTGVVDGRILRAPRGEQGFGYDPLFLAEGQSLTMAELPPEQKNALSHRGKALRKLRTVLDSLRA